MVGLSIKDGAAANRIAGRLAPWVTNSIIDGLARELGFHSLVASNKTRKIQIEHREIAGSAGARMAWSDTGRHKPRRDYGSHSHRKRSHISPDRKFTPNFEIDSALRGAGWKPRWADPGTTCGAP